MHFIHQHWLAIGVSITVYLILLALALMFNYGAHMGFYGNPSISEAIERRRLERKRRHAKQLAAA